MARAGIRRSGWLGKLLLGLFVLLVVMPASLLLVFRFIPVPGTPQMLWSLAQGKGAHYRWSDELHPILGKAVIGSEDQNFCSHSGFDWKSIDQAVAAHERRPARRLRGASTISQQTARTLFLVPARSWIRKGMEAYLTVLIEALWPKKRILEAYLNLVDWGHGNFGAEAAARAYFDIDASRLTRNQAARLAAVLPDPDKWNAAKPGPYVAERTQTLIARAADVSRDNLDFCVK
jgi:monofunctional glycosyltransferase